MTKKDLINLYLLRAIYLVIAFIIFSAFPALAFEMQYNVYYNSESPILCGRCTYDDTGSWEIVGYAGDNCQNAPEGPMEQGACDAGWYYMFTTLPDPALALGIWEVNEGGEAADFFEIKDSPEIALHLSEINSDKISKIAETASIVFSDSQLIFALFFGVMFGLYIVYKVANSRDYVEKRKRQ